MKKEKLSSTHILYIDFFNLSASKITRGIHMPRDTPTVAGKKESEQSRMRQFQIKLSITYLYKIPANVILIQCIR